MHFLKFAHTGFLGNVEPRPALAHPRALAITDDGDDDDTDETLYATEFFSMPRLEPEPPEDPTQFDRNRQGIVYPISLGESQVGAPITIAPVLDTGFVDSKNASTGCFPNQLYAAAADGGQLFVTSLCASPAGPTGPATNADGTPNPANFKTLLHPSVFVIDTRTNQELPDRRLILTRELDQLYAADNAEQRPMPLIPNDMAFASSNGDARGVSRKACITAMGADAVFCVDYDDEAHLLGIGSPASRFVDLAPFGALPASRLPVGVALSTRGPYALVVNDNTQSLAVVDLKSNAVVSVTQTAPKTDHADRTLRSPANEGRQLFATGLDVWSFKGQAWASCESCHPDGLSDGVTWFFARGPRRTISTAGTYYGDAKRRVMLWTGNIDEVHDVEVIVRTVAGGVGAVLSAYPGTAPSNDFRIVYDGTKVPPGKRTSTLRNNLNGSLKELHFASAGVCKGDVCDSTPAHEWDKVDAFIQSVRAPARPTDFDLDPRSVSAGGKLFINGRCPVCHGGPGFTLSNVFYTPGDANNGTLPYSRPAALTPDQLGLLRTAKYTVPPELAQLNPPGATGEGTLRRWDPGDRDPIVHLYGTVADDGYDSKKTHANDQINCVLRAVGTFPPQGVLGVVATGSPTAVQELRQDMTTLALGATGFNIPSLLGVAAGAPFFHAGNARTLEEVFDPVFTPHHQGVAPGFLSGESRAQDIHDLVMYLLSIDDDAAVQSMGKGELGFDPDLCSATSTQIQ